MFDVKIKNIQNKYSELEELLCSTFDDAKNLFQKELYAAFFGFDFHIVAHTNCPSDGSDFEYLDSFQITIDNIDGFLFEPDGSLFSVISDIKSKCIVITENAPNISLKELKDFTCNFSKKYKVKCSVRTDDRNRYVSR